MIWETAGLIPKPMERLGKRLGETATGCELLSRSLFLRLYHGKRKGYIDATKHVVKELFWKGSVGPYYVTTAQRSTGYRLSGYDEIRIASVEVYSEQKDYTGQWASIAKSMRRHGINPGIVESIEAHLRGEAEYIDGFQNYWTVRHKPRKMSFKDVTGGLSIPEMKSRMTKGSWNLHFYREKRGARRDRSISLFVNSQDELCFHAASEYSGYGNGDYYVMYSPTMAFYAETD